MIALAHDIEPNLEPDLPPTGTPCCVCKAAGHWCQADQYVAGGGEVGLRSCGQSSQGRVAGDQTGTEEADEEEEGTGGDPDRAER